MSWDETLMLFLGGGSLTLLIVSLVTASGYRDTSVFWNTLTAASASSGITTFFWWLCDHVLKEVAK